MAYHLVAVESGVICDAVKFLIFKAQQSDGLFREVGRVNNREMVVRAMMLLTSILHLDAKQETTSKTKPLHVTGYHFV